MHKIDKNITDAPVFFKKTPTPVLRNEKSECLPEFLFNAGIIKNLDFFDTYTLGVEIGAHYMIKYNKKEHYCISISHADKLVNEKTP